MWQDAIKEIMNFSLSQLTITDKGFASLKGPYLNQVENSTKPRVIMGV